MAPKRAQRTVQKGKKAVVPIIVDTLASSGSDFDELSNSDVSNDSGPDSPGSSGDSIADSVNVVSLDGSDKESIPPVKLDRKTKRNVAKAVLAPVPATAEVRAECKEYTDLVAVLKETIEFECASNLDGVRLKGKPRKVEPKDKKDGKAGPVGVVFFDISGKRIPCPLSACTKTFLNFEGIKYHMLNFVHPIEILSETRLEKSEKALKLISEIEELSNSLLPSYFPIKIPWECSSFSRIAPISLSFIFGSKTRAPETTDDVPALITEDSLTAESDLSQDESDYGELNDRFAGSESFVSRVVSKRRRVNHGLLYKPNTTILNEQDPSISHKLSKSVKGKKVAPAKACGKYEAYHDTSFVVIDIE